MLGGNEADSVDMLESRGSKAQQIFDFCLRGNDFRQTLPGIPGAFNNFY
jgi:hypothetical protein